MIRPAFVRPAFVRPTLIAVVTLAGLAAFHPARAQRLSNVTGGQLVQLCTNKDAKVAEQCLSYISGVADAAEFFERLRPSDGSKGPQLPGYVCVPSDTKGGALRDAVTAYVKKSPENANRQASGAVMSALYETFPCKK